MRIPPIPFAALLFIASLSTAQSSVPSSNTASARYRRQLAAKCPEKHLEMLSPAALSDVDDAFLGHFTDAQRRSVQSSITRRCRGIDMGATCGNVGFLQAAIRLHKLDDFTTHVCAVQQRCTEYSMCTDTR